MASHYDFFDSYMMSNAQSDCSEILPAKLYLSGRTVPQNLALLNEKKITHVLSVTRVRSVRFLSVVDPPLRARRLSLSAVVWDDHVPSILFF